MTGKRSRARVFWSGGSQAVRLPKELRLQATEVLVSRRGRTLVIEEPAERDDWAGFWDQLVSLKTKVRRWRTAPVERRRAV